MLNRRSQAPDEPGLRGITDRADCLIDRFRVRYEFGGGWTCGCADFAASEACRHTRRHTRGAAGRYIVGSHELIETSEDGENGFAFAVKGLQRSHHDRMFLEAEGSRRDATVELQDSVRLLGGYVR